MNCPKCDHALNSGAAFCGDCGATITETKPEPVVSEPVSPSERLKKLAETVWKALVAVLQNPVENLSPNFEKLKKQEALEVGIAFAVLFDLCALFGVYMMLPRWAGAPGFADILKILIFGFVPPAALTGAGFVARKVFRASGGTIESDVFLAGISLIPIGILLLLSGVLGIGNFEVIALVAVFALSYTILILYTGCNKISEIATVRAVPAVPSIFLVTAWLSKIVFAAML
jgi:hypothetical protein